MYKMMSNEIKEKIIQELKKFFEEIKYNKDWVKAIEAMERAVNFGYKGDYSIIGRVYFDGVGNLLPNHKKAFEWLSRFYLDYKNGEIEDNIEAKTMLELCYDLSNLYVNCIILKSILLFTAFLLLLAAVIISKMTKKYMKKQEERHLPFSPVLYLS